MNRLLTRFLLIALLMAGALLFGYFSMVLLTPVFGRVVGYANEPPQLQVERLPDGASAAEALRILNLAQQHFASLPQIHVLYWPEPALLRERTDCWLVQYNQKIPIYGWCGFRVTLPPADPVMSLTITKGTDAIRHGNWCP